MAFSWTYSEIEPESTASGANALLTSLRRILFKVLTTHVLSDFLASLFAVAASMERTVTCRKLHAETFRQLGFRG